MKKHSRLHEPFPERGCVEDQPQQVQTFGRAAAGAPSRMHTAALRTAIGSRVQCAKRPSGKSHPSPLPSILRRIIPLRSFAVDGNLYTLEGDVMRGATEDGLGDGELSADRLIWRSIRVVHCPNAFSKRKRAPHEPYDIHARIDSPSPRPSPAGRGRIVVRFLSRRATRFSSWFQCIRKNRKGTFHELRDRFYQSLLTSAATRRERLLL
jgi:hypothetical protein